MKITRIMSTAVGLALLVFLGGAPTADAAEITVLCSNGIKAVVEELVPKFERETKHKVTVTYGLTARLKQQIEGGAPFDLAILTPAAVDDLIKQRKIAADSRTVIARTGLGLAVRVGAPKPNIATTDAFKRTLLGAKSIIYAKEGASGVLFAEIIQRLGIAEGLKPKIKLAATAEEVGESVVRGDAELGVLPLSEILPIRGAELGGMFPPEAQTYIVMTAGASTAAKQGAAAKDLIKFLTAPAALPTIKAKGMETVTSDK